LGAGVDPGLARRTNLSFNPRVTDDAHRELRLTFVSEIAAMIPRIAAQLDVLREDPAHADAVEETRQFFHRIAGAAASVELGDLGRVAGICERVVTLAQRGNEGLLPHLHAILRDGHRVVTNMLQDAAAG
jgi:chemotaxis protein histidine kinase CheA